MRHDELAMLCAMAAAILFIWLTRHDTAGIR